MAIFKTIKEEIEDSIEAKQKLLRDPKLLKQIEDLSLHCLETIKSGGKVIFAGNGGSFGDSQHLSAEFTSRFLFDRAPMASVALGTNSSSMSAIGNDYGYDNVFSRELEALGNSEDIFIAITTSGNSENIIQAIEVAKKLKIKNYVLTGGHGGKLKDNNNCICMPSSETARIQECHILVGHMICGFVEKEFFK